MSNHKLPEINAQLSRIGAQDISVELRDGWAITQETLVVRESTLFYALALLPDGAGMRRALEAVMAA